MSWGGGAATSRPAKQPRKEQRCSVPGPKKTARRGCGGGGQGGQENHIISYARGFRDGLSRATRARHIRKRMAKVEHCKIYTIVAKYRRERDGKSDTIIQHLPTVSHAAPLAVWTTSPARLGSIRFDSIHLLLSCEARGKREDPSAGPPLRSPGVCEEPNPSASSASRK